METDNFRVYSVKNLGCIHARYYNREMRVQELVGAKVRTEQFSGYVASIPKTVDLGDIWSSISASVFRIDLPSGDVITTAGTNIIGIELSR